MVSLWCPYHANTHTIPPPCSIGDATTFMCDNQQTTGPFGQACPLAKGCRTRKAAYRKTVRACVKNGASKCDTQDNCKR